MKKSCGLDPQDFYLLQLGDYLADRIEHVASQDRSRISNLTCSPHSGLGVDPGAGNGCFEGRHSLCKQSYYQSSQDVARAGARQGW